MSVSNGQAYYADTVTRPSCAPGLVCMPTPGSGAFSRVASSGADDVAADGGVRGRRGKVRGEVVVRFVVRCGEVGLARPCKLLKGLAPQAGLEPATLRLTAGCSAIELLRNRQKRRAQAGRLRHGRTFILTKSRVSVNARDRRRAARDSLISRLRPAATVACRRLSSPDVHGCAIPGAPAGRTRPGRAASRPATTGTELAVCPPRPDDRNEQASERSATAKPPRSRSARTRQPWTRRITSRSTG